MDRKDVIVGRNRIINVCGVFVLHEPLPPPPPPPPPPPLLPTPTP